jgi:hypothetical protein
MMNECSNSERRRGRALGCLAVLTLSIAYASLNVGAPFASEGMPTELAIYCELMSQPWDELGFGATLGMPMLSPVGDTVAERHPYIHHPAAGFWPNYAGRTLLGKSEEGYRIFPVVATGLSALLLYLVVSTLAGAFFAFLVSLLFLVSPQIQLYGAMPNSEPYTLLCALVLVVLYLRYRTEPSRKRLLALLVWFLIGSQVDWQFYFMAPGIWVAESIAPRGERHLKPLLLLLPAGILGFLLVIAHMWLAVGSIEIVATQIKEAVSATQQALVEDPGADSSGGFLATQARNFRNNFGTSWAVIVPCALLALLAFRRWRHDDLTRVGVACLAAGVVTVTIFNRQAAGHEYFWNFAAAGCPVLVVQGGRLLLSPWEAGPSSGSRGRLVLATLLVAVSALTLWGTWDRKQAFEREQFAGIEQIDRAIDELVGTRVCLSTPDEHLRCAMLYSRHRWAPPLVWPEQIRKILSVRDEGRAGFEKLVIILTEASRKTWPEFCSYLEQEARTRSITPIITQGMVVYAL